jgi:hypothetical protein
MVMLYGARLVTVELPGEAYRGGSRWGSICSGIKQAQQQQQEENIDL